MTRYTVTIETFDPTRVTFSLVRFSATQWEVALFYGVEKLSQYGGTPDLVGGQYVERHQLPYWVGVAQRVLAVRRRTALLDMQAQVAEALSCGDMVIVTRQGWT